MIVGLDHVGIAVLSLDDALRVYRDVLGLGFEGVRVVASEGVRIAMLRAGDVKVELMEPTGEGPVSRFLERRGPGLHHIALAVTDIHEALRRAVEGGLTPVDREPRVVDGNKIAFIHPKSTGGVLIELVERAGGT